MLSTRQLSHLLSVLETGSVHAASRQLGLTQAAVTRSIQTLENLLQVELFDRSRSGMLPTAFCLAIEGRCQAVLHAVEDLEREALLYRNLASSRLSISFGRGIKALFLPRILPRFMAAYPEVSVDVKEAAPDELVDMLHERKLDFFIAGRASFREVPDIEQQVIQRSEYGFYVRTGHALLAEGAVSYGRIGQQKLVAPTHVPPTHPLLARMVEEGSGGEVVPHLICDNYAILCDVVTNSDVVLVAPIPGFSALAESHGIERLEVRGPAIAYETTIIHLKARTLSPAARKFIAMFKDMLTS